MVVSGKVMVRLRIEEVMNRWNLLQQRAALIPREHAVVYIMLLCINSVSATRCLSSDIQFAHPEYLLVGVASRLNCQRPIRCRGARETTWVHTYECDSGHDVSMDIYTSSVKKGRPHCVL